MENLPLFTNDTLLPQSKYGDPATKAEYLYTAAKAFAKRMETTLFKDCNKLNRSTIRAIMSSNFGGDDTMGYWSWRDAYDAIEAAQVLLYSQFLKSISRNDRMKCLLKLIQELPTATIRSELSIELQHFSTPLLLAEVAAGLLPESAWQGPVIEPSAGNGMLAAIVASTSNTLVLNEIEPIKAALLKKLFPACQLHTIDASRLADQLPTRDGFSACIMNPPFQDNRAKKIDPAGLRHVIAGLQSLRQDGHLVAILPKDCTPQTRKFSLGFAKIAQIATIEKIYHLPAGLFRRSGTEVATTLILFQKTKEKSTPPQGHTVTSLDDLLSISLEKVDHVKPKSPGSPTLITNIENSERKNTQKRFAMPTSGIPKAIPLNWQPLTIEQKQGAIDDRLYEPYQLETIAIENGQEHPTSLVQSAAMASVSLPALTYTPNIPFDTHEKSRLSLPQLETIAYAGQAHNMLLPGYFKLNSAENDLIATTETHGFRVRRGFALGDGTGCGKGREISGIIYDNWTQGRKKALWISKSDTLIEDAKRDWKSLGCDPSQIVNLGKYKPNEIINLKQGILFVTLSRLRSEANKSKHTRLDQIIDWLGEDFDGVIALDECHGFAKAAPGKASFQDRNVTASKQGVAGLKLQAKVPDARIVYSSATIATKVEDLSFATRLGLWGSIDMPFPDRSSFISAMVQGGVAALEVVCRDLKATGLYIARALSFDGIEYEILEHNLSHDQINTYNRFADAYEIIHNNLQAALEHNQIAVNGTTMNSNAKGAALSAFEGTKQRLFNHLLISMATPSLIKAVEKTIDQGEAAIIQLISTGEALMERRLATISPEDRYDIQFDITPREYVIDYLKNSFPIHLHDLHVDDEGRQFSELARDKAGNPVICQQSLKMRDNMIEDLCSLPPIQCSIDQILHHFGHNKVAEVTGRKRRIVLRKVGQTTRRVLQQRSAHTNIAETNAFLNDTKQILLFSEAGGTGRSYHSDASFLNRRPRKHYIIEPGWRADIAIQGLGRSNRSNQVNKPTFIPVTTDVKGQRRFTSTIASRLDTLGAITRGDRVTGGQGLYNGKDNLESSYAKRALMQFYRALILGKITCISLDRFTSLTGLKLTNDDGSLLDRLPPIRRFLNRILALRIEMQNDIFDEFEAFIDAEIRAAIEANTFETGLTTLDADNIKIIKTQTIFTHPTSHAETFAVELERRRRTNPLAIDKVMDHYRIYRKNGAKLVRNQISGKVALQMPFENRLTEDFTDYQMVTLIGILKDKTMTLDEYERSKWQECSEGQFSAIWEAAYLAAPKFVDDTLYMITGILLPIWHKLEADNPRVVRLQTDCGKRMLGRLLSPEDYAKALYALDGSTPDTPTLASMLLSGTVTVGLNCNMTIRRSKVMDRYRIEITGAYYDHIKSLKQLGAFTEIIAFQTRIFIPTDEQLLLTVLDSILARFGVDHIEKTDN